MLINSTQLGMETVPENANKEDSWKMLISFQELRYLLHPSVPFSFSGQFFSVTQRFSLTYLYD